MNDINLSLVVLRAPLTSVRNHGTLTSWRYGPKAWRTVHMQRHTHYIREIHWMYMFMCTHKHTHTTLWNSAGQDRTYFPLLMVELLEFYKLSFSFSPHFWLKRKIFFGNTHQSSLLTDDSDCYGWNANWEQTHITENISSRPLCLFSPRKLIKHHQITTAGEGQSKGKK